MAPKKSFDFGTPRFELCDLDWLAARPWPKNAKTHDLKALGEFFAENGLAEFPTIDEGTKKMVAGHGRVEKLVKMRDAGQKPPGRVVVKGGKWMVWTIRGMTFPKPGKHVLASNRGVELGGWDNALLSAALAGFGKDDLFGTGFGQDDFATFLATGDGNQSSAGALATKFLVPPFSVLDARQGYWQERKRAWLALGIKSELGRVAPIGGGADAAGSSTQGGRGGAAFQQTSEREVAMLRRTGDYATGRKRRRAEARGQR
jgi:hypothetical protein